MGINIETAKKAEEKAKEIAKQKTGDENLYELFLIEAYDELFDLTSAIYEIQKKTDSN